MTWLALYIPMDRRHALACNRDLPASAQGTALFADISGFTPLAQALASQLGPQRAAEELTFFLNQVYDALIAQVHAYGGSVIGFVGDAITCWFEEPTASVGLAGTSASGPRYSLSALAAIACATAMQAAMTPFAAITVARGVTSALHIKIGMAAGPARRYCVGDPDIQQLDVLAGETLRRMSQAEGQARRDEILADESVALPLQDVLLIHEWRVHPESGRRLAVVQALQTPVAPRPWPPLAPGALSAAQLRSWVLPALHTQLATTTSTFRAELRPATSLFLRFSGLDYDTDPEAGVKLDVYIRWVQQVVTRHGGAVIQLTIGDKGSFLYAAFGAPIAYGDDAYRAVQAGLALSVPPTQLGFTPQAQIGIASGPARTGEYGSATRRTYGVIGDDAVLAARLMAAAPPGEIRCAHSIYIQTRARVGFEILSPVRVKGRAELVRVYRPLAQAPTTPGDDAVLVGRRAEVQRLECCLKRLQAGQPCVLLLEGEAGIGKTRLIDELKQRVRERGFTGLLGAGQSIEQQTPYRAWRDVFTAYFAIEDINDPALRRKNVATVMAHVAPERVEHAPLLNALLDLDFPESPLISALTPELRQQTLRQLLVALLVAWARSQPLILVLEDAHWLDALSWQLAEDVARRAWVQAIPLLLVVVYRPLELGHFAEPILQRLHALPGAEIMRLEGLAPEEIVALAAQRLGVPVTVVPEALTTVIQSRSGGNPFFVEELLHALCERGVIEPSARITGDLTQAVQTLPDTLHGLILARIDRLPAVQQAVLKVAAVIGRSFPFAPLHAIFNQWHAPLSELALRTALQALNQRDFTFVEVPEPELTYVFKHIITQEAAYQTLLFAQRRELHALTADWYAAQPLSAMQLPLLVHHYHRAERPTEERRYAMLAGEQAARYYDNANAVAYFSRALVLTPADEAATRYSLLLAREAVYEVLGERAAQAEDIAALAQLAAATGNLRWRATVALRQARYARALDDYPRALQAAQTATHLAAQCADSLLETQSLRIWGTILRQQGEFDAARQRLEQALAVAREHGHQQDEAQALYDLGTTLYQEANYTEARAFFEAAQALYATLEYRPGRILCALMFGALSAQMGDYMAEREQYKQALAESRAIGWRYAEGFALNSLGNNAFDLGDYRAARDYHLQALQMGREVGHREGVALSLDTLGLIYTMLGEFATALELGQEALALQREIEDTYSLGYTLNHLGLAWLGTGQPQRAAEVFTEALALRRALEQGGAALDDLAGLARAALMSGSMSQARDYVTQILTYLNEASIEGAEFPVWIYLTCYRVLYATREYALAEAVRAKGLQLLQTRASAIHDPTLRAQFLECVPFNAELLHPELPHPEMFPPFCEELLP